MPPPQAPLPLPPPFQMRGEDGRARSKHLALMQDYEDLVKETKSIRKVLQSRKKQKLKLMAEVRFLRRKYKSLLKNSYQNPSMSKNQLHCSPSPMETCAQQYMPPKFDIQTQNPDSVKQLQTVVNEKNYREKEKEIARSSRLLVLDLNQASLPNDEEAELQVAWETMKMEKPLKQQHPMEADPISSDLRLSLCRDTGNGTSRSGKRKISWQDPVALRV